MKTIIYTPLRDSLKTLGDILQEYEKPSYPTYLPDAMIKRYEYSFELSWKSLKRHLEVNYARALTRPRDILREGHKLQYIENIDQWLHFMDMRNITSHTYSEDNANKVLSIIPDFYKEACLLLKAMEDYDADRD
jgi:nucleotidyltransferase substrate binding protein (TIGR01987 family)